MLKRQTQSEHTESEPLSVKLKDGRLVSGTLWVHPSRRGSFFVEYGEVKTSDHRSYPTYEELKSAAKMILRELAEKD